jgi:hypothetical protein
MLSNLSNRDRRELPRISAEQIEVELRPQGRLARFRAQAVDFNRYGIAVLTEVPLKQQKTVYVTLRCGELRVDNLPGVVHNCCQQDQSFRSGIRFRIQAELKTDRPLLEALLTRLESTAPEVTPS